MTTDTMIPLTLPPATTTTDQVFEALYAAVISLRLPPGTKVSEADIARRLDVSRQPVRDAFFRLSKLGFLSIRPQRATLVTRISPRAVLDAVFVRSALEMECIARVCDRIDAGGIAELTATLEAQHTALDSENADAFHAEDDRFHQTLCRLAGHAHVWDIIQEQKAHMDRVRFLTLSRTRRRQVLHEHGEIMKTIEMRDPDRSRALLGAHIRSVEPALEAMREQRSDCFEDGA